MGANSLQFLKFDVLRTLVLKGVYYDGWRPAKPISDARELEEFLEPILEELNPINANVRDAAISALQFLAQKLEPGLREKILLALPQHIRDGLSTS